MAGHTPRLSLQSICTQKEVLEAVIAPLGPVHLPHPLLCAGRLIFMDNSGLQGPRATNRFWPPDVLAGSRGGGGRGKGVGIDSRHVLPARVLGSP